MNTSTKSAPPVEHREALQFISRVERRLKRRTRQVQQRLGLAYTDALSVACTELGLSNHFQFRQLMESLRSRAKFFSVQEDRVRCATEEAPHPGSNYYLFRGFLNFDSPLTQADCGLMPKSIAPLMSTWVGWTNEKRTVELRVASHVDPNKVMNLYRDRIGEPLCVINTAIDLYFWMLAWGGTALIRSDLAHANDIFSRWLAPFECEERIGVTLLAPS